MQPKLTRVVEELRKIESKATKGPWHPESPRATGRSVCYGPEIWTDGMLIAQIASLANFDFANAQLMCVLRNNLLALLDVVEAAAKLCDDEESGVSGFGPDVTHIAPLHVALARLAGDGK